MMRSLLRPRYATIAHVFFVCRLSQVIRGSSAAFTSGWLSSNGHLPLNSKLWSSNLPDAQQQQPQQANTKIANTADYLQIVLQDAPLLDVRAPVEFLKGSLPNAQNVPILNDEHRELVGTCYKEHGAEAAKELGRTLVHPELQAQLVQSWKAFAEAHPDNGYLYCFRGGLRSHIAQQWLQEEAGISYPLIEGGYKDMRTFLMEETINSAQVLPIVLIGGRTASGKTHLLKRLGRYIDLEGLAKHRGSSFGSLVEEQPSQIDFENNLSVEMLKLRHDGLLHMPVFMEDESRRIGQRILPLEFHTEMLDTYPLVILEAPMEDRVKTCIGDYVTDLFPLFLEEHKNDSITAHEEYSKWLMNALFRIKKRLGDEKYTIIHGQWSQALKLYKDSSFLDESGFHEPLETLLREFYDPMYDYQLEKKEQKEGQILFRGTADEVVEWAKTYSANQ
jgi:tRNA 2-selenouridine synthase